MHATTSSGDEVARRLIEDGYVVVSAMMSHADVEAARADLGRVLEATRTGRNAFEGFATQRIYALFAKTRTFDQAAIHPLLLEVLDKVLGHYQLSAPVGIRIGPGEQAQVLHTDDMIYPIPQPHRPVVVNTMRPLDEFTGENGATRFLAGSHRWEAGRLPTAAYAATCASISPPSPLFSLATPCHPPPPHPPTPPLPRR